MGDGALGDPSLQLLVVVQGIYIHSCYAGNGKPNMWDNVCEPSLRYGPEHSI